MKSLIVIGHPDENSFCYNGIFKTILKELKENSNEVEVIDLYRCSFTRPRNELIDSFKKLVMWSENIYIISPVWWFRLTPRTEIFFDEVFTPGFAYNFKQITKTYGIPVPKLGNKKVITYLTHGAPALPVYTIYLNSVWGRLQLGVFSFVYGWFRPKIRQFFSVPFCSESTCVKYLSVVQKDIEKEIKKFTP